MASAYLLTTTWASSPGAGRLLSASRGGSGAMTGGLHLLGNDLLFDDFQMLGQPGTALRLGRPGQVLGDI